MLRSPSTTRRRERQLKPRTSTRVQSSCPKRSQRKRRHRKGTMKKPSRKLKVKKVTPLAKGVHHVELELYHANPLPAAPIPEAVIELPPPADVPEIGRAHV